MDKMKKIPFIVPPADEQVAIVEHIKRMLPKYDVAIEKLSEEVAALEECKAKLIAEVVTGKIDVRNVKIPDYEYVNEESESSSKDRGELEGEFNEE